MDNTIKLSIVTPDGEIFNDNVKSVVLPGKDGEFGVLPSHSSLVSALTVGVIEITETDNSVEAIAINWGHVKVSENSVDALVDSAVALKVSDKSTLAANIEKAHELVQSVKDANIATATVSAKLNSFS